MHQFKNCLLCPHCIYVFCIYLRTNSDLCHLHHKLTGFYNRVEKCLQRGTNWAFKYSGLHFVFKRLSLLSFRSWYSWVGKEILCLSGNPMCNQGVVNSRQGHPIWSQFRTDYIKLFCNIAFNIITLSTTERSKWFSPIRFPNKEFKNFLPPMFDKYLNHPTPHFYP
jgi:hypothetical protein